MHLHNILELRSENIDYIFVKSGLDLSFYARPKAVICIVGGLELKRL